MTPRLIACLLALALAAVVAACGGGSSDAGTQTATAPATASASSSASASATAEPTPADFCAALIPTDQVTQILGEAVVSTTPAGGCVYAGVGIDQITVAGFTLGDDPVAAAAQFQNNKAPSDVDITGFGDAAYWNQGTDPNNLSLCALKGTGGFCVNVYTARGHDANLDIAKRVAGVVVGNLE